MREIKFKLVKNNKIVGYEMWFEGDGLIESKWVYAYSDGIFNIGNLPIEHKKKYQYTGLKDKNGTEIYLGDIIEITEVNSTSPSDFIGRKYKVIWQTKQGEFSAFCLQNNAYIKEEYKSMASYFWYAGKNCKVIGNVHENPELLK